MSRRFNPVRIHRCSSAAKRRRARGLSVVELLVALLICAMLLTATTVALNASFLAYADVATQTSAQVNTRMVIERLLTLLRTSTAQGPLNADSTVTPPATLSGNLVTSPYIELIDTNGNLNLIQYNSTTQQLILTYTPAGSTTAQTQPILGGVTAASFYLERQLNSESLWVLQCGTMDITVLPGADATLALESGIPQPIRVIASTMPRKNQQ